MLSNSKAAHYKHDHQRCISAAIKHGKSLCAASNTRLTPIREAVLSLIWQSHKPLGAYTIVDQLPAVLGKRVLAPTVYRAIDFLLEMHLIHRIASLNAYIGCPFPGSSHSDMFLICKVCGTAAECSAPSVNDAISRTTLKTGFQIESQSLEIIGLCPACLESTNAGS